MLSPEFIGPTTFEDGSSVKFRCDIGYEGAGGSSTITCTNGQWSTLALTCKSKYFFHTIISTPLLKQWMSGNKLI